ncbi:hypothetical protein HDU91_004474 [Kappamyces sp. JEL0680]|nr:hypothetical protein HDU91_004474 [Kappamyces sp. JEL0680]
MRVAHLALASMAAATTYCNREKSFCVVSQLKADDHKTVCFTVHSTAAGWAGFGIGNKGMNGADIFVGWKNSTKGYTIANLQASTETQPTLDPTVQNIVAVPLLDTNMTLGIDYSFCRPLQVAKGKNIEATTQYIWAFSTTPLSSNIDSPSASFPIHTATDDQMFADFTLADPTVVVTGTDSGPIVKPSTSFTFEMVLNLHAALMWVAWVVCPLAGIFVARYLKSRLGHNWFRIHMAVMGLGTGLLGIGGVVVLFLFQTGPHFNSNHSLVGLGVSGLMIVQIALGIASNLMFDPNRAAIPLVDKAHWWIGRLLFVAALVNIQLGFMLFQTLPYTFSNYVMYGHWGLVGIGLLLFIGAEFKFGQDNHVKKHDEEKHASYQSYSYQSHGGYPSQDRNGSKRRYK